MTVDLPSADDYAMRPVIARRSLLAGASLLAAPAIVRAQGQNGVALVIGNSKYQWEASLPNVKRDVHDIAECFQSMGLKTELIQEADRHTLPEAVTKFAASAKDRSFAAFYFAGHGAQPNANVHLVPVDADLSTPNTAGLLDTTIVRRACTGALSHMRVYDNCRNNPADGWRQRQTEDRGILRPYQGRERNTLGLFSTLAGRVALDGPAGQNSPFASALIRQLVGDSVDLSTMPAKIRRDVLITTRGRQVVQATNHFLDPFVLKGAGLGQRPAVGSPGVTVVELPKAYAFARDNKIPLPDGLVAIAPQNNNPLLRQKVGTFRTTEKVNGETLPMVVAILSAEAEGDIQVILAGPLNHGWWRLVLGRIQGARLEFEPYDSPGAPHLDFTWRNNDGGSVTTTFPGSISGRSAASTIFERLDG